MFILLVYHKAYHKATRSQAREASSNNFPTQKISKRALLSRQNESQAVASNNKTRKLKLIL